MRKALIALCLPVAVNLVACGPESGEVGATTEAPSSPTASAPPGFPDMSAFTESGEQFARQLVPRVQGFAFSTPSGLICGSNAYPEPKFEHVDCRGPMPSQGPGDWSVGAGFLESGNIEPLASDPDFAADKRKPPAVLPPMHKVTSLDGVAVCGVDDSGTTACRVGDHGFVLTPTSTELF